ncbi:MAG TPA: multidrug effflux MFS transporter [Moraxellaceae bacterium]|nr:multidrug effflux MFS transporter [Moraxellaceae bacterium]
MRFRPPAGWILLMGALTALGPLSIDMYLPAFPSIARELGAPGRVELTLASFFIGLALGQLVYGPLSDHTGRKPPLYVGLTLYVLASVGASLSHDIQTLVVWRFLQGMGGCAGMVISRAVVRDRCTPVAAAQAFSLLMLIMGIAPILAPLTGSYLVTLAGWRALFAVLAIAGAACLLLVWRGQRESLPSGITPPSPGRLIHTYLDLLSDRGFLLPVMASGLAFSGMFTYIAGSPFVLMQIYGLSPHQYGWVFGSNAIGLIAASQLNALLLRRGHAGMPVLLRRGLATAAFSSLGLALLAALHLLHLPLLLAGLFVYITSLGFISPNASASALAQQGHQAGTASALMGALQFMLATLAGSSVSLWHDGSPLPLTSLMALCGVCAWTIHQMRRCDIAP